MAANASPGYHVTGAVHSYVAVKPYPTVLDAADYLYLGTAESTPVVQFIETFKDVKNDTHGDFLPAQRISGGTMAQITLPLNRYSATTHHLIEKIAAGVSREGRFERGRLIFGRLSIQLWMLHENYVDAGVRAGFPNMPIGWWFPQVVKMKVDDIRMGNRDRLRVLTMEAHPYFVPQADPTTVDVDERTHLLFSQDANDFPAAVQVPQ